VCVRVGWRDDEVAGPTWWPPPLGRGEEEEVRVAAFAAVPSAPRRLVLLSGEVVTRTAVVATSGVDRTTGGVAVTSTCSAGVAVGTPLAPVSSAEGLSSVVVVTGGAGSEAESESFGSGRDWRFD
jgi:hypothetical protein